MARSRVREIWFVAALASIAACGGGTLQGGATGGRGGGSSTISGTGGITGMNCAEIQQPLSLSGIDALILLDASASMNDAPGGGPCDGGCGANSKWAQAAAAINTVVAQTDGSVNWGLALLGDSGAASCSLPGALAVPVVPAAARSIAAAIAGRTSANGDLVGGGERLTRPAVNGAVAYFATSPGNNRKLIVLVTDGAPSCLSEPADPDANDTAPTADAINSAALRGISTFVVGIAISAEPAAVFLRQLAQAGGAASAGSPAYYPAAGTPDLVTALNSIVTAASSCLFPIPPPPNVDTDRFHIGVSVDGLYIPQDPTHANGWDFADYAATHLQLYGPPCDTVTSQPASHPVAVVFRCTGI